MKKSWKKKVITFLFISQQQNQPRLIQNEGSHSILRAAQQLSQGKRFPLREKSRFFFSIGAMYETEIEGKYAIFALFLLLVFCSSLRVDLSALLTGAPAVPSTQLVLRPEVVLPGFPPYSPTCATVYPAEFRRWRRMRFEQ